MYKDKPWLGFVKLKKFNKIKSFAIWQEMFFYKFVIFLSEIIILQFIIMRPREGVSFLLIDGFDLDISDSVASPLLNFISSLPIFFILDDNPAGVLVHYELREVIHGSR